MNPFLTCSSLPHPSHRSPIRSPHRQSHCRPIWAIYAALKPSLHELATNAAKHGSLSAPEGRVRLAWSVDGERFRLSWRESGGPAVAPPARAGFGRLLLERAAAHDLGGQGRLEFRPAGVAYELETPVARVRMAATPAP